MLSKDQQCIPDWAHMLHVHDALTPRDLPSSLCADIMSALRRGDGDKLLACIGEAMVLHHYRWQCGTCQRYYPATGPSDQTPDTRDGVHCDAPGCSGTLGEAFHVGIVPAAMHRDAPTEREDQMPAMLRKQAD